jgi:uncharacterized protein YkwD
MGRNVRRRDVLRTGAAAIASGLAGCFREARNPGWTPTPTPSPEPMQPFDAANGDVFNTVTNIEREVHKLSNEARAARDIDPLVWDPRLAYAGRAHCRDMAKRDFYSHRNPDGESPQDRLDNYRIDYRMASENAAKMYFEEVTARGVAENLFQRWKNSGPHWRNIINDRWDRHGTGVYIDRGRHLYGAQEFIMAPSEKHHG